MITAPIRDDITAAGTALGGQSGETAELYAAAAELAIAAIGRQ